MLVLNKWIWASIARLNWVFLQAFGSDFYAGFSHGLQLVATGHQHAKSPPRNSEASLQDKEQESPACMPYKHPLLSGTTSPAWSSKSTSGPCIGSAKLKSQGPRMRKSRLQQEKLNKVLLGRGELMHCRKITGVPSSPASVFERQEFWPFE